jgi:F-type H+-transporting ATPase subunit gamma
MASIRIIKRRIKSAKNISQVTKALQMVSAVKMRRAQEAAIAGKPYATELILVLRELAGRVDTDIHPFLVPPEKINKILMVVIGPEKGLAGALVSNIARKVFMTVDQIKSGELKLDGVDAQNKMAIGKDALISIVTWGKKARDIAKKTGLKVTADFSLQPKESIGSQVRILANLLAETYLKKEADLIILVYANFINTVTQKSEVVQFLPMVPASWKSGGRKNNFVNFEPSANDVLAVLLNHYLETVLNQIILDSLAAEYSARMVAMKNAYDNATDIIKYLTLTYNQTRQSAITNEIADIVSGSLISA